MLKVGQIGQYTICGRVQPSAGLFRPHQGIVGGKGRPCYGRREAQMAMDNRRLPRAPKAIFALRARANCTANCGSASSVGATVRVVDRRSTLQPTTGHGTVKPRMLYLIDAFRLFCPCECQRLVPPSALPALPRCARIFHVRLSDCHRGHRLADLRAHQQRLCPGHGGPCSVYSLGASGVCDGACRRPLRPEARGAGLPAYEGLAAAFLAWEITATGCT